MVSFDPEIDVPNLSGKTILVTGGTAGLGKETLYLLAPHGPSRLLFTGQNGQAADTIISEFNTIYPEVEIQFYPCDHTSLSTIVSAATSILTTALTLDIIICNAGAMPSTPSVTPDGFESNFSTNYLSHWLLVQHLLPSLHRSSDSRIILISSDMARTLVPPEGISFSSLKTPMDGYYLFGPWRRHAMSKLALALMARSLSRRHEDILSVSLHPGIAMTTGLQKEIGWPAWMLAWLTTLSAAGDVRQAAGHGVWAAVAPREHLESGRYYRPIGERDAKIGLTEDDELAEKLWAWTETELNHWTCGT